MANLCNSCGNQASNEGLDDNGVVVPLVSQLPTNASMRRAADTRPCLAAATIRAEFQALLRRQHAEMLAELERFLFPESGDLTNTELADGPRMAAEAVSQVAQSQVTTQRVQDSQAASSGRGTSPMQAFEPNVEGPTQSLGFNPKDGDAGKIALFSAGAVATADEASPAQDDNAKAGETAEAPALHRKNSPLKNALSGQHNRHHVEHVSRRKSHVPIRADSAARRVQISHPWSHRVLTSTVYELLVMGVVTVNAAFIGLQVQENALLRGREIAESSKRVYFFIEIAFCIVFSLELLLRVYDEGKTFFWSSTEWRWNVFDSTILASMQVEMIVDALSAADNPHTGQVSFLRVLRICRLMRCLRIIKLLRSMRELRVMFASILSSIKPLCWVCSILLALMYTFGIALTSGVVEHLNERDAWEKSDSEFLIHHFGSLDSSMLSLFEAMTGGISWGELFDATQELSLLYPAMFLAFIAATLLGLLNVITGVFLDTAQGNAKADHETMIAAEMAEKKKKVANLALLFHEIDVEGRGSFNLEQLMEALEDERVQAYLSGVGLSAEDAESLFVLLDRDQQGEIDTEEFLEGCMKLLGQASGVELAKVALEGKWVVQNVGTLLELVNDLGGKVAENAVHMAAMKRTLDALSGEGLPKHFT